MIWKEVEPYGGADKLPALLQEQPELLQQELYSSTYLDS
jgi:hypothetical protein